MGTRHHASASTAYSWTVVIDWYPHSARGQAAWAYVTRVIVPLPCLRDHMYGMQESSTSLVIAEPVPVSVPVYRCQCSILLKALVVAS